MKAVIRSLCALILLALCIQAVAASFAAGNVVVSSKGKPVADTDKVSAGTPMTATIDIDFTASSGETFPA